MPAVRPRLADRAEQAQLGFVLVMLLSGWFSIAVSQIALGLGLAAMLVRWGAGRAPVRTGLEWSALALALWALLTIPFSTDPQLSVVYYRRFYLVTAIWVAAGVAGTGRRRILLLAALGLGAVGTSLFHQIQPLARGADLFAGRLEGAFNAMTTGALLMLAAALGGGWVLARGLSRKWWLVAAAATLSLTLGVVQTVTRSAALGLVCGWGLIALVRRPRLLGGLLAGLLLIGVVFRGPLVELMPDSIARRVLPSRIHESASPQIRLEMWRGGWSMIQDRPVFGFGDVGLLELAPQYYGNEETIYFGHMHSNLVHMAVIWGLPGLVLGVAFLTWPGWLLWRGWRRMTARPGGAPPAAEGWLLGALAAWLAFNVAGLTEWYFGDAETMLIYLGLLGCALGAAAGPGQPTNDSGEDHVEQR